MCTRAVLPIAASFSLLAGVSCVQGDSGSQSPAADRWKSIKREIVERFPAVEHVSTEVLRSQLDRTPRGFLLVDVRAPEEFAVSRLTGARNAPIDSDVVAALAGVPVDRPIVVYCSVGYRSAQAARRLKAAGFRRVRNYLGSIFEWANRGLPLEGPTGATDRVHPYDDEWGELLRAEFRYRTPSGG